MTLDLGPPVKMGNKNISQKLDLGPPVKSQSPGFLGEMEQGAKDIVGGLGRGLTDLGSAAASIGESALSPIVMGALSPQAKQVSQAYNNSIVSDPFKQMAQQLPGNQDDILYNVGRFGPDVVMGTKGAVDLAKLGAKGVKQLSPALKRALKINHDELSTQLVRDVSGNQNISAIKDDINNKVRNLFNNNKSISKSNYKETEDLAKNLGYEENVGRYRPGISIANSAKRIDPKSFESAYGNLDLDEIKKLEGIDLKGPIQRFKENPSFKMAHELQSRIGEIGGKMASSLDNATRRKGASLLRARRSLINDIDKSFRKNGDHALADKYKSSTEFHKKNIASFLQDNILRKVVTREGLAQENASNIVNALAKNIGGTKNVVEMLPAETKDKVALVKMGNIMNEMPSTGITTTSEKLLNSYGKLGSQEFNKFKTDRMEDAIRRIEQSKNRDDMLKKLSGQRLLNRILGK